MRKMIVLVFISIISFSGCDRFFGFHTVKYSVTGTAPAVTLIYQYGCRGKTQRSNVTLPWEVTFEGQSNDFVYISAVNLGDYGTITVNIYKNGKIFKTETVSGPYETVIASGSL